MKSYRPATRSGESADAPSFRLLSNQKVWRIHEASLKVLEDVGARILFVCTPMITKPTPEIPAHAVNLHEFQAMVSNTTKPLMLLLGNVSDLDAVLDMAEAVAGSAEALRNRPFVSPFLSAVSPLVFNAETLDKLLLAVDRGIPVRCGSGPMAGATGPVGAAGTSVVCISEIMVALVISQVRRPGAPFIWGASPAILDMKTANIAYTTPESVAMRAAVSELTRHYGLPTSMAGCISSSMAVDQQAALEQMMGACGCILAGVDMVNDVGALESALVFSPEAAVLSDEIIGMARRVMRGMPVDDESLALDTVRAVGPGGNFLETEHTFRHYKREQWQPTFLCRTTYDSWAEGGGKLTGQRLKEKLGEIMRSHQPKPLSGRARAEMSRIIQQRMQTTI